jgi:hypothetical protein
MTAAKPDALFSNMAGPELLPFDLAYLAGVPGQAEAGILHFDIASWRMFLAKLLASPLIVGELRDLVAETAAVSRTTVTALSAARDLICSHGQRPEFDWLMYASNITCLRALLSLRLQFGPMTDGTFVLVGVDDGYSSDQVRELVAKLQPDAVLAPFVSPEHFGPEAVECTITALPEELRRPSNGPLGLFMTLMMNNIKCKHAIEALVC